MYAPQRPGLGGSAKCRGRWTLGRVCMSRDPRSLWRLSLVAGAVWWVDWHGRLLRLGTVQAHGGPPCKGLRRLWGVGGQAARRGVAAGGGAFFTYFQKWGQGPWQKSGPRTAMRPAARARSGRANDTDELREKCWSAAPQLTPGGVRCGAKTLLLVGHRSGWWRESGPEHSGRIGVKDRLIAGYRPLGHPIRDGGGWVHDHVPGWVGGYMGPARPPPCLLTFFTGSVHGIVTAAAVGGTCLVACGRANQGRHRGVTKNSGRVSPPLPTRYTRVRSNTTLENQPVADQKQRFRTTTHPARGTTGIRESKRARGQELSKVCPKTAVGKLDYSLSSSVSFARPERARAAGRIAPFARRAAVRLDRAQSEESAVPVHPPNCAGHQTKPPKAPGIPRHTHTPQSPPPTTLRAATQTWSLWCVHLDLDTVWGGHQHALPSYPYYG
eukprot:gene17150-biopygen11361